MQKAGPINSQATGVRCGLVAAWALTLLSCSKESRSIGSEQDAGAGAPLLADASLTPPTPSAPQPEAALPDAALPEAALPDAAAPAAAVDSGAGDVTAILGRTGHIQIAADGVGAYFSEDDLILRAASAPECVAHLHSVSKPHSAAGTLTVTSDLVGQSAGPPGPLVMDPFSSPDDLNAYFASTGVVVGSDAGVPTYAQVLFLPQYPGPRPSTRVQVALSGSVVFPAFPVLSLRSSPDDVEVTEPSFSGAEVAAELAGLAPLVHALTRAEPLIVKWRARGAAPEAVILWVSDISVDPASGGLPVSGDLFCRWPAAAGEGAVPAALLGAIHDRLGTGAATGDISIVIGDAKEIAPTGTSYFVYLFELSNLNGTECGLIGPPCVSGFASATLRMN